MLPMIVGWLVNSGAIYFGARLTRQEANLVQCGFVALISVVTVWLAKLVLAPLGWLPLLGGLVGALAVCLGCALALKFVMQMDWKPALQIGGVVALVQFALALVFSLF